jgi:phosphatidate phosphatase APP1
VRAGKWAVLGSDPDPYEVVAYRGYGNGTRVLIRGRAQECENTPRSTATDSTWRNLLSTYKRIEADPLAHAQVVARIAGVERTMVADDEGFFREWIALPAPLPTDKPWQPFELELVAPVRADQGPVKTTGLVRILEPSAAFGVISDLDDTVIQSHVANFLQAVRTVMLGNARTRLPFPGVAAFYAALEKGVDGTRSNPIFYVSSSPWNIYDVIGEFLELQRMPMGPICLRDWDIELSALKSSRIKTHKEPLIREILELYPTLPFILIGDTSQKDPEIYREITKTHPGRILAIYIRNVSSTPERSAAVQALAEEVLASGSSLILADDTDAAARHSADNGWIAKDALPAVHEEKKADQGETGTKVDAPGVPDDPQAPTVVVE